jgi:hypothetical protein
VDLLIVAPHCSLSPCLALRLLRHALRAASIGSRHPQDGFLAFARDGIETSHCTKFDGRLGLGAGL